MKQAVFVSRDKDQFVEIEQMLSRKKVNIMWTPTGKDLMSLLSDTRSPNMIDMVVMAENLPDTPARSLVESVVVQSPFTLCVVAGTMDQKEFHDVYEGYGVLMQLSERPTENDARDLEAHLDKLAGLGA